jgi:hypothetical protein
MIDCRKIDHSKGSKLAILTLFFFPGFHLDLWSNQEDPWYGGVAQIRSDHYLIWTSAVEERDMMCNLALEVRKIQRQAFK